ncbi:MAG: hypothetical protein H7840_06765 [Alphaproteobacteria bacterium]
MDRMRISLVILALALLPGACASVGPTDNPLVRKFTWFSYLNGDDLRADCRPGAPDAWRLVYNGSYLEQVRTYDLRRSGERWLLAMRVIEPPNLARGFTIPDILEPWRGVAREVTPAAGQVEELGRAVAASGAFDPPPEGLSLSSDDFFWTAAVCRNGEFRFNAWAFPSPRFSAITFESVLRSLDVTDVPFNPPRQISYQSSREREEALRFTLRVVGNGLGGLPIP